MIALAGFGFTPGEEFILEWQFAMAGGFKTALAQAITKADDGNLEKLRLGFPDEVTAFISFAREPGWFTRLESRFHAIRNTKAAP